MAQSILTVNLPAIAENWRRLDRLSPPSVETGAVLKANSYGLGIDKVAPYLEKTGVKSFFVALAEEGKELRKLISGKARIFVLSGYMKGDKPLIKEMNLIPVIVTPEQYLRFVEDLPNHKFGIQIDTGMNRLGMEPEHFLALKDRIVSLRPELIMSHLGCADEEDQTTNRMQLRNFRDLTKGMDFPLSLSATGGILLGDEYFFDLCRPGIGLFGGLPFNDGVQVLSLKIPVIQVQKVCKGEGVGYNRAWIAPRDTILATVAAGYADGLIRSLSNNSLIYANNTPCPVVGRVSMDMITVDVSGLQDVPEYLEFMGLAQRLDDLARQASTIGHELLTSLGQRYKKIYVH